MTAALFAGLAWRLGPRKELLAFSWLAVVGVQLALTDPTALRLPNRLTLPSYPAVAALLGVAAAVEHNANPLRRSVAGMLFLITAYGGLSLLAGDGQIAAAGHKLAAMHDPAARHKVTHLGMPNFGSVTGRLATGEVPCSPA